MTVEDVLQHHAQLIEEALKIARSIVACRTAEEVEATMMRLHAARMRADEYIDKVIETLRAKPGNLPRA